MKLRYCLLATLLVAGGAHAAPYYGPGPMSQPPGPVAMPQAANPAVELRAGVDRLLAFLGSEPKPPAQALAAFLDQEIAPFFDFDYMASSAGGRLFEQLNSEDQQALVAEIKQSFLTKMAEKLGAYDSQQVRFLPPRAGNDGKTAQVSAAVLNPGSYPARLDFRLYRSGNQWRVYDVAANGQSAIVHYRQQLMRQMQQRRMAQMRHMAPPMQRGMPPGAYGPVPMR
ncbi:MAG: ABC transporter substrate-binding protein [Chromatiaceae bacterium]|nr:ABC transporter substrate-binding protein [Chromatiaceae bacterium]MCP5430187.1 ABC transporter substrate-binding protein [Chromatiaceae bacterium]MCP5435893.1 ABC transporter substrate-binding protein [Chromatiaceae bacterium]HOP16983.1 ABC transporter substrate-binding protein [Gammaproteobacteria bacterium]HPQ24160.1 ABC transporter substrate-binding protein [Gammaproteobacteria bacterium]